MRLTPNNGLNHPSLASQTNSNNKRLENNEYTISKLNKDCCNEIHILFNDTFLKNKFHFIELYIYYLNFVTKDKIERQSFVVSSKVLFNL